MKKYNEIISIDVNCMSTKIQQMTLQECENIINNLDSLSYNNSSISTKDYYNSLIPDKDGSLLSQLKYRHSELLNEIRDEKINDILNETK